MTLERVGTSLAVEVAYEVEFTTADMLINTFWESVALHGLTADTDRLAEMAIDSLWARYSIQPQMPTGDDQFDMIAVRTPEPDMHQRSDDPKPEEDGFPHVVRLDPSIATEVIMRPIPPTVTPARRASVQAAAVPTHRSSPLAQEAGLARLSGGSVPMLLRVDYWPLTAFRSNFQPASAR